MELLLRLLDVFFLPRHVKTLTLSNPLNATSYYFSRITDWHAFPPVLKRKKPHSFNYSVCTKIATRVSQQHLVKKIRLEGNYDALDEAFQPLITLIFCSMETGILIEMSSCKQLSNVEVDLVIIGYNQII